MNIDDLQREEPPPIPAAAPNGQEPPAEFLHWKQSNTIRQKQDGYFVVQIKLPLGGHIRPPVPGAGGA